ncbi:glycoside hydrolase family 36 protein [Rhabdothermincola sediminis]|uniref:glycoside hydrolase family 36 protein n=1 Tax=Rhabdothermincola sediminis TaxID=2751370 RepID=UPI001AA05C69|nr:glycoside hydrolase family 36 protein [Rhabdothermincola sediminis]
MEPVVERIVATIGDVSCSSPVTGPGTVHVGGLDVALGEVRPGTPVAWSLTNAGDAPVRVRSVAVVFRLPGITGPLRMLRHGYQSWSRTDVAVFGVDRDPSTTPGSVEMMQGIHHADQRRALDGELRSEWLTVLRDAGGRSMLAGFDAGVEHDGTWRLRPSGDPGATPELWAEAFLGDAQLGPGESRALHPFVTEPVADGDVCAALDRWARRVGSLGGARISAPYQVGWCSWYHYFHGVTEQHVRDNLSLAGNWPFEVFQIDDGYQSAIGDWLTTNEKFPSSLDALAGVIAAAGRRPGIWLAPFIVAPDSEIARRHPEWLARFADGQPLWGMVNPEWGGGRGGVMYALDTTRPEVLAHIEEVCRSLVEAGFTYLKLDFTFAPSFDGVWSDPSCTPAQRVRAGYEAVRRGAGDGTFLLGCGVPLSHVVGLVDGNRIGPDVAPSWSLPGTAVTLPGYEATAPATLHSWASTLSRSFMHRRLWLNDPDCLMLRTDETDLTVEAITTWAHAVAVSGGMALVSDDLALLGAGARSLLDDVVVIGRAADRAAIEGAAPRCEDLMDAAVPTTLTAAGYALTADPATATSTLSRPA